MLVEFIPELSKSGVEEPVLLPKRPLSNIGIRLFSLELHVGIGDLRDRRKIEDYCQEKDELG